MKRIIFTLLSVLIILPLQAQDEPSMINSGSPPVVGRLGLISPKLIAEIKAADHFTITTGFWIRSSIPTTEWDDRPAYRPMIAPSFTVEPRYYFNLEDRQAKGKRTDYFSGWYVGVPFNIEFPDFRYSIGGTVGFQCTMGKRWYWNISFGPGITYANSRFHAEGAGDFGLGIILNKM